MRRISIIMIILAAVTSLMSVTLEESIDLALKNNLSLQAAAQDIGIADGLYREVTSSLLPQISFTGGYQLQRTELPGSMIPPAFDVTGELSDSSTADEELLAAYLERGFSSFIPEKKEDETTFIGQIKLDQVVYLGGKLMSGIRAAGIYRTLERKRYEMLQQELTYQTTDMFYQGLLLKELIEINREAVGLASQHFNRIQSMYEQGLVSEFDLIRAELELLKLQPQLEEAENNYTLWLESFRKHLGYDEEEELIPQGEIVPPAEFNITFEEALKNAQEKRIELFLSESTQNMYEIQWRAERGNYLPNVALSAEYNRFSSIDNFGLKPDSFGTSYQVMLGIQIPIFTGFRNRSKIAQARHEYKKASINHQDLEDKIELDVRNAYQRLSYANENYRAQSLRVGLAERGLRIASTRYENQIGINLEVLDAQLEYKIARLSYLQAVYEKIMSHKGLQKAMGNQL